ncbi:MAG: 4-(cytidine 5'-diphospho)-2-C-methyl-D-erythritol kinase [Bacillota bacterium]|nr:4-(cytidine 5'-diphospho)-2-C-methyl-D-erythritol kinase [Bacillota bacterium]
MLIYRSAAKINLFLSVRGSLPGGYHELTSVMQSVSLYDTLTFDFGRRNFSLYVPGLDLGAPEDNIVTRLWRLMKGRFGLKGEVEVTIEKNIPVGAGLAGGSGNGAALIRAANDYFSLGLSLEEMASIGGEVGADIPFCVMGGTALAKGRGEKLKPLPPLLDCGILLAAGGFHVSTKDVFTAFDTLSLADRDERNILKALEEGSLQAVAASLYNDLERVTLKMYPRLEVLKRELSQNGLYPLMSGSGPTIFALIPAEREEIAKETLERLGNRGFLVRPEAQGVKQIQQNKTRKS